MVVERATAQERRTQRPSRKTGGRLLLLVGTEQSQHDEARPLDRWRQAHQIHPRSTGIFDMHLDISFKA